VTEEQKKEIITLRRNGDSYRQIADKLNLTKNQVVSFCRRSGLIESKTRQPYRTEPDVNSDPDHCRNCGAHITQQPGRKPVLFCSDRCCQDWWNHHPEKVHRRPGAIYHFTCAHCGKAFTAYGNQHRKYCCHACYIADRFKGGDCNE